MFGKVVYDYFIVSMEILLYKRSNSIINSEFLL